MDKELIAKVMRCLFDTVARTTDFDGAYNDNKSEYVTWEEISQVLKEVEDDV